MSIRSSLIETWPIAFGEDHILHLTTSILHPHAPTRPAVERATYSNNFDALRLTGALFVLFSHQFALIGKWEPRFVGDHSYGNLGVLIFFSISGFLVAGSWVRDPNIARFLTRRSIRLAPGYVVAALVAAILIRIIGAVGFPRNPMHATNGSLWTIPFECYCYLIFAFLGLVVPRFVAVTFTTLCVSYWVFTGGQSTTNFLAYFGLFFASGALISEFAALRRVRTLLIVAPFGMALIGSGQTILGLATIVPLSVIMIGTRSWPVLRSAGRFGDLSYGIYLYAWPVQQLWVHLAGAGSSYLLLVTGSLVTTLVLAVLSWHLVEKVALRYKPRTPRSRAERAVPSLGGSAVLYVLETEAALDAEVSASY